MAESDNKSILHCILNDCADAEDNFDKESDDELMEESSASGGSAYEKETIINYNNAEKEAYMYSCNFHKKQELLALAQKYPDDVKIICSTKESIEVTLPKKWIKIRPPRKISEKNERLLSKGEEPLLNTKKNKKELFKYGKKWRRRRRKSWRK